MLASTINRELAEPAEMLDAAPQRGLAGDTLQTDGMTPEVFDLCGLCGKRRS
jgi:hypothetical protein